MYILYLLNMYVYFVFIKHVCIFCIYWICMYILYLLNMYVYFVFIKHVCIFCIYWICMYILYLLNMYVYFVFTEYVCIFCIYWIGMDNVWIKVTNIICLITNWFRLYWIGGRKEMFYLTTHSTHFIYGYMVDTEFSTKTYLLLGVTKRKCLPFNVQFPNDFSHGWDERFVVLWRV